LERLKYKIVAALNAGEDGEKPQSLIYCWWEHKIVVTLGTTEGVYYKSKD